VTLSHLQEHCQVEGKLNIHAEERSRDEAVWSRVTSQAEISVKNQNLAGKFPLRPGLDLFDWAGKINHVTRLRLLKSGTVADLRVKNKIKKIKIK
jgi:hypothetical protein